MDAVATNPDRGSNEHKRLARRLATCPSLRATWQAGSGECVCVCACASDTGWQDTGA